MIYIHIPRTAGGSITSALEIKDNHKTAYYHQVHTPEWAEEESAAFIRNPWTHAVSWWFWSEHTRWKTFAMWVEAGMPTGWSLSRYRFKGQPMGWPNPSRQEHWIEWDGKLLVDHIFKVENIEEDFGKLCALFKKKRRELPIKNKAKHKEHRLDMWTPSTLKMAEPVFRPFAEKYGYDF